jgi:hypothetical protein
VRYEYRDERVYAMLITLLPLGADKGRLARDDKESLCCWCVCLYQSYVASIHMCVHVWVWSILYVSGTPHLQSVATQQIPGTDSLFEFAM